MFFELTDVGSFFVILSSKNYKECAEICQSKKHPKINYKKNVDILQIY